MAKHVIAGKVRDWRHTIFTVEKAASSEQQVIVHFGRPVHYRVVKLSVANLPRKTKNGRKITWINNFAVVDSHGHYVKKVRYTVFVRRPKRKNVSFVYHDQHGLGFNKTPKYKGKKPPRHHMLQVDFSSGDPGQGWKTN